MYKMIVRARLRSLFRRASMGDWQPIVDELADTFRYQFVGDSPLGGVRTKHSSMEAWFRRLMVLFPGARFDLRDVMVAGPPWNTRVMTYFKFRATVPGDSDGGQVPYENEVMQAMTLRWGRITEVLTLEDTQRFVNMLPRLAAAGIAEATAAPITDIPEQPRLEPVPAA
jgi:ketosteroid isomerase-like protein